MSELLSLPAGDQHGGFIAPARDEWEGVGTMPTELEDAINERLDEIEADTQRVLQAEHDAVIARADEEATKVIRVASLVPNWCSIKDTELVLLHVYGSGFTESAQIWWHDHLEPTEFVSENELTTYVTPWLFLNPDNILVGVQDSGIDGDQQLYFRLLP